MEKRNFDWLGELHGRETQLVTEIRQHEARKAELELLESK